MNQIVFAVANDRHYLFAMRGSKTAVQLFGLTFLKIRDYFLGSAQIAAFLRIIVGRMLGKIAHYLEAGSRVGGHLFVEFDHIGTIAHKCNSTTVASLAAVYLNEMPEYKSV